MKENIKFIKFLLKISVIVSFSLILLIASYALFKENWREVKTVGIVISIVIPMLAIFTLNDEECKLILIPTYLFSLIIYVLTKVTFTILIILDRLPKQLITMIMSLLFISIIVLLINSKGIKISKSRMNKMTERDIAIAKNTLFTKENEKRVFN